MEPPWTPDSPEWQHLDQEVRTDHLVRLIDTMVDELIDLEPLERTYAGRGTTPYSPKTLVKLVVYEHAVGHVKPTQWLKDLEENKPVQWLVRGLFPKLTCLCEFRDRVAPWLDDWSSVVVRQTMAEGHTTARVGALDGTAVAANATRHHLVSLEGLDKRIEQLDHMIAEDQRRAEAGESPATEQPEPVAEEASGEAAVPPAEATSTEPPAKAPGWMGTTPDSRTRQRIHYQEARRRLDALHKANENRRKDKRKAANQIRISLADLDAVLGLDKLKVFRPLYNVQVMTDVSSGLVLASSVIPTAVDSGQLVPMIDKTKKATGVSLEAALVDAGYPSGQDLAACKTRGVTIYAPWQQNDFTEKKQKDKGKPTILPKGKFTWDAEHKRYICPEGNTLSYAHKGSKQKSNGESVPLEIYQADPNDCRDCPLRGQCVQNESGARTVRRQPFEEHVEELVARMETAEAKALYGKRGPTAERPFADFKEHRSLQRFSGRGLRRAEAQVGLTVLAHNLRTLAKLRAARAGGQRDEEKAAA